MPKHTPNRYPRPSFRPQLTPLEDRSTPAVVTQTGTTLIVDLNSTNEVVTFTTTAAGVITVESTAGIILNGSPTSGPAFVSGVTLVLVDDSAAATGVDFGTSSVDYAATFVVTLDNTPQAVNIVGDSAFGTNSLTVTTTSHITATAAVSTTTGNISLSANRQATPTSGLFFGIDLFGANVSSTTGTITLSGRGGDDSDGQNIGVFLHGSNAAASVVGGTVVITGTGGASLGQANHGVFVTGGSTVGSTGNGTVVVTGTGGGTGSSLGNVGVLVSAGSVVTAAGLGSVTVTGSGGAGTSGGHVGVSVTGSGSQITSRGGSVDVTGTGGLTGSGNVGVAVDSSGAIASQGSQNVTGAGGGGALGLTVATGGQVTSGDGPLTVTADSIDLDSTATVAAVGDSQSATIRPNTPGTLIDLGGADVLTGSPLTLGLTDAELDRVSARGLTLGRSNSGALSVTSPLTRPTITDLQLISGGDITFSGGGVDTAGGTLVVSPNTGFTPTVSGTDATASSVTFTSGSVLNVNIQGTTADTEHTQLNVSGGVDLSGVGLSLSGSYVPVAGDSFTIVSATSVSGTLTGLANGATVTFNGVNLRVVYTPTAVVLRVNSAPANVSAGGPYTTAEGSGLVVSAPAATDADGDTLTYTWDVNGDGTFGDETAGSVTDGGRTVTYTAAELATLGLNDGPRTVNTLAVRASDGVADVTSAFDTLTVTNVPPSLTSFAVPPTGTVGQPVASSASASDPAGANDPLAFAWVVTLDDVTVATGSGTAFAFTPATAGTYTVAVSVSDGDGGAASATENVIVTAVLPPVFVAPPLVFTNAGRVRVVYPDGTTRDLEPFPGYLGDVTVASADMTGDGIAEVIVGAGPGGGPHVVVFDGATGAVTASFFAYDVRFTGGVYVAATTDGRIVTGAGAFGGPHVKVIAYSRTGQKLANGQIADTALVSTFFAYDVTFLGGVRVAAADITGDGVADIVTGAGPGGGPHVKVFDGVTAGEVRSFFAFAPDFTGGVQVAAATGYFAVGADTWGGPHVKAFDASGGLRLNTFAYPADFVGGVRVALADVDPDGVPEVVTAPGLSGGQVVKAFRLSDSVVVSSFTPFDPLDPLGVFVG